VFLRDNEVGALIAPHVRAGDRILDFGAGTGLISRWLARRTGVRPTLADLVDYSNRRREFPFVRMEDPFRVPVEDGSFDVVLLLFVLHHNRLEQQGRVLAEAARISGGRVIVLEDTPGSPLERRINGAWDRVLNLRHGVPTPLAFRTVPEWVALFPGHGLEPRWTRTYRPMWPTLKTYHHTLFVLDTVPASRRIAAAPAGRPGVQ
jgi:SAM-dependent methyltransferase